MVRHSQVSEGEIHPTHNWTVPDIPSRNALVVVDGDIGKEVRVGALPSGPFDYYKLTATGPITWLLVGTAGTGVTGGGSSTDNALVRWDGATGTIVQDSIGILDDVGNLTGITIDSRSVGADGTTLDNHVANLANPHATTAAQVGADPAGSAATVQTNLTTHISDTGNPHATSLANISSGTLADLNTAITDADLGLGLVTYVVGPVGSGARYNDIASALVDVPLGDPAQIFMMPGTYVGNVTIPEGISLWAASDNTMSQVIIDGTLTYNFGPSVAFQASDIHGIEIAPTTGPGIVFTGTGPQHLTLQDCQIRAESPIIHNNTGSVGAEVSTIYAENTNVVATTTNPAVSQTSGRVELFNARVTRVSGFDDTAIDISVAGYFQARSSRINGRVLFAGTSTGLLTETDIDNVTATSVNTTSSGQLLMWRVGVNTAAAPAIDGTGPLTVGDIGYTGIGVGLAPTLNSGAGALPLPTSTPYIPITPVNWVTSPTSKEEALDRIAAAVQGLLAAPIP